MKKRKEKVINFKLRYIPAFVIIVILVLIRQLIVDYQINQDDDVARTLNIAGRQRMLSQMISKDVYILSHSEDADEIRFYLNQLIESSDELENINEALIAEEYSENSQIVNQYFTEIQDSYNIILSTAREVVELAENNQLNHDSLMDELDIILLNEPVFLDGMDKIVNQYELEAEEKITTLTSVERILFWIVLVVLIFIVFFVFVPFEIIIKKDYERINDITTGILKTFKTIQEPIFLISEEDTKVLLMSEEGKNIISSEDTEDIFLNHKLELASMDKEMFFNILKKEEKVNKLEVDISRRGFGNGTYLLSSNRIKYMGIPSILITLFDISIQKNAEEALRNMSMRDKLTGLYNRHFLDEIIVEEMERALRYNFQLSVFILDLDHFKNVNDTWGHPVGDIILKETAELATRNLRRSDFLVRLGGEEFLLLMPHTNLKEAMIIAEKIRKEIEAVDHQIIGKYTASFGVAQWDKSESIKELYERVDEALYRAKERGRNRVISSKKKQNIQHIGNPIAWKDEWASGNELIDEQHKDLLEIANKFVFLSTPQSEPMEPIQKIDELIKHVKEHFKCEEGILKESGYLGYIEHSKMHRKIEDDVENLKSSYNNGEIKISAFFTFMLDEVVIGHLLDEDVKFFSYIKKIN